MVRPAHGGSRLWAAAIAQCEPAALLDFSASISPLGPPPSVLAAMQRAIAALAHYPEPGYAELRSAIAQYHALQHHGLQQPDLQNPLLPEHILPGNGAAELLTWVGRELAACAEVYLFTPAFGDYQRALGAFGAKVRTVPLAIAPTQSGSQVWEAAWPVLGPQQGVILNNPHNPTGQLFERSLVRAWLEAGALVVVDEAFMDFVQPEQQQSVSDWVPVYPNLVVLRSLTKFYSLAGLRLGYAIAQPERLARWQRWRDPWPVNCLAEVAAIAALADGGFQAQTWDWLAVARERLFLGLQGLSGLRPYGGAANFLLVEYEGSVVELQAELLRQDRILIRDCLSFPELGDRFFRVAVRTTADNERLLAALLRLLA